MGAGGGVWVVVVDCVVVVSVCAAAMDEMAAMAVAAPRARIVNVMAGLPIRTMEAQRADRLAGARLSAGRFRFPTGGSIPRV